MKAPESIITGGVGAELEDPRRQELIDRLDRARSGALGEYPRSTECAQEVWAALWLCPVEKLEEFVKQIEMSPGSLGGISLYTNVIWTNIINPWITAATGVDSLSMSAEEESLERDGKRCVITKIRAAVESAHIYPYSLRSLSGPEYGKFWTALAMFWPENVIEDWKSDISWGGDTEHCANRVTLSANAHVYWGKGLFALKPVSLSEDQKCLELKFHWLRPVPRSSSTVLLSNKPSLEESLDGSAEDACLFDATTDRRISSGHRIRMETDDPVRLPLPSVELLKLQWTLQRLAALSGATILARSTRCLTTELDHLAETKPYRLSYKSLLEHLKIIVLPNWIHDSNPPWRTANMGLALNSGFVTAQEFTRLRLLTGPTFNWCCLTTVGFHKDNGPTRKLPWGHHHGHSWQLRTACAL